MSSEAKGSMKKVDEKLEIDDKEEQKEEEEEEEEEEQEEKMNRGNKSHNEGTKHGRQLFRWDNKEHRLQLSACLYTFPQELVHLVGSLVRGMEWSEAQKTTAVVLSSDDSGLRRVARHLLSICGYHSVMSQQPLSPPSFSTASSSLSSSSLLSSSSANRLSVTTFQVRVDRCRTHVLVGVSGALPPEERAVGGKGCGVSYGSDGLVCISGVWTRRDGKAIRLARYDAGDVIGVELDFRAKTVAFFKNDEQQDRPVDISDFSTSGIDFAQPLYAVASMYQTGDKVTLL